MEYLTLDGTSNLLKVFTENNDQTSQQSEVIKFEKHKSEEEWEIIDEAKEPLSLTEVHRRLDPSQKPYQKAIAHLNNLSMNFDKTPI